MWQHPSSIILDIEVNLKTCFNGVVNMMKMKIISIFLLLMTSSVFAEDIAHIISGADTPDLLAPKKDLDEDEVEVRSSPFSYQKPKDDNYQGKVGENSSPNIVMGTNTSKDLTIQDLDRKKLKDSGYVAPGTLGNEENYLELNKEKFTKEFRHKSTSAFNISYFSDSFQYQSEGDIINHTISEGYKHVKAGMIHIASEQYVYKTDVLNLFWVTGAGVSYNSGRGIFVNNTKSETTITLWEVPVDLGLGVEIPIYHWFKVSGSAGPSGMILNQNRNDFLNGEKGKSKYQFSYGEYASAQFKINLSGLSDNLAYDLFTESQITTLSMNLEARYENYKNFQDKSLAISGTSLGLGFTFEFL
jgi:hypothetical protein